MNILTKAEQELAEKLSSPPPSKAEPHEKERASVLDLLAKVRITRDTMYKERARVEGGSTNKDYVWVNVDESRQVEYQGMGYELCTDPTVHTHFRREDGTHRRGDLVLYQIDKELHEAIGYDSLLRAYEGIESPRTALIDTLQRHGAKPYNPPER